MGTGATEGQAADTDLGQAGDANLGQAGTTDAATGGDDGQSISSDQTTVTGTDKGAQGESFFDPESIKDSPDLMAAYKGMQRTFGTKMEGIRDGQQKIDAYDAAMRDPAGTIRQLAAQQGMTVVNGQPQSVEGKTFDPKSWEEVVKHVTEQVQTQMSEQYAPLVGEVKNLKEQNIRQYLDGKYNDWKTYETEMISTLQAHPSMANDPDKLYQMSIPSEVLEARATERALKRLKGGAESGAITGTKRATQTTSNKPTGLMTFDESVAYAKDQLRKQGISRPVGG